MPEPILPDDLWERIEPLIPKPRRRNRNVRYAGRRPTDPRKIMTGIIFALKTGVPWEFLAPTSLFPSGYTCLRKLKQWHRAGVWYKLLSVLLAALEHDRQIDWDRVLVDSSSVRAPHGGRKTGPNPTERRKLGSKHHLLTDANGIPLAMILTGANRHDVTQLLPLVSKIPAVRSKRGRPRNRPKRIQGDRAYDSEAHRRALKKRASSQS